MLTCDWLFGLVEVGLPDHTIEPRRTADVSPVLNDLAGPRRWSVIRGGGRKVGIGLAVLPAGRAGMAMVRTGRTLRASEEPLVPPYMTLVSLNTTSSR